LKVSLNLKIIPEHETIIFKLKRVVQQGCATLFFTESVTNAWNNLDEQTVTATAPNFFKRNLDRPRSSTKMGLIWTDVARP